GADANFSSLLGMNLASWAHNYERENEDGNRDAEDAGGDTDGPPHKKPPRKNVRSRKPSPSGDREGPRPPSKNDSSLTVFRLGILAEPLARSKGMQTEPPFQRAPDADPPIVGVIHQRAPREAQTACAPIG